MPVPVRGQRVDQRLNCFGIIADERARQIPRRLGVAGTAGGGFLPANLVAVVRDGLGFALLVVLCGKLCQHINGLLVAARHRRAARRVLRSGRPREAGRLRSSRPCAVAGGGGTRLSRYQYWRCWNG